MMASDSSIYKSLAEQPSCNGKEMEPSARPGEIIKAREFHFLYKRSGFQGTGQGRRMLP